MMVSSRWGRFRKVSTNASASSREIDSLRRRRIGPDEFLSTASATALRDCPQVALSPGRSLGIFGTRRLPRPLQALSIAHL